MSARTSKLKIVIDLKLSFPESMTTQEAVKQFTEKNNFKFENTDDIIIVTSKNSVTYNV